MRPPPLGSNSLAFGKGALFDPNVPVYLFR
jgi:hypothetical protein